MSPIQFGSNGKCSPTLSHYDVAMMLTFDPSEPLHRFDTDFEILSQIFELWLKTCSVRHGDLEL